MLVPMSQRRRHNWAKPVGGGIVEVIVSTAIISENFRANPSIDHKDDRKNRGMKGAHRHCSATLTDAGLDPAAVVKESRSMEIRSAKEAKISALTSLLRRSWLTTWAPELPFAAVERFAADDPAGGYAENI